MSLRRIPPSEDEGYEGGRVKLQVDGERSLYDMKGFGLEVYG